MILRLCSVAADSGRMIECENHSPQQPPSSLLDMVHIFKGGVSIQCKGMGARMGRVYSANDASNEIRIRARIVFDIVQLKTQFTMMFGEVDSLANTRWEMYAAGGSGNPTIKSPRDRHPTPANMIRRYIRGKPNGKLIWKSIQNGPTPHPMITDPPPTGSTVVPAPRKKLDSEFNEEENKLEMADTQAEIILSQDVTESVQRKAPGCPSKKESVTNADYEGQDCKDGQRTKRRAAVYPTITSKITAHIGSKRKSQEMQQDEHSDFNAENEIDENTISYDQYLLDKEAQRVPTEISADTSDKMSMIAILTDKDICSIVLTSDSVVPPSSNCLCEDLRSACDREHTKVLELEAEISKQKQLITESEKRFAFLEQNYVSLQLKFQNYKQCIDTSSASNAIFEINKLRQQLQGKDDTIRNLDAQINIMKVLNVGSTEGSCDQQALETDRIQLKDTITSLRIQLDGLKVENVSLKRRYDELSQANTHSRTAYTEKLSALTAGNNQLKAQVTGKTGSGPSTSETPKVLAPGMYNLGSKYIPPPKRANWVKPTPLPKKRQVNFSEPPRPSLKPTQKLVVHPNKQTNVCVPMSTGVKPTSGASKPVPKRALQNHSSLPAKSANARRVEAHHRTLNKKNRVDSNLLVKHSVSVSNLNNVCDACNKSLVFANHNDCLVMCDDSVNVKTHQTKRLKRQPKKEWKPSKNVGKPIKRVWKPISKLVANSKPQWKPTGRHFSLFEKYPLTRIMEPTDMPIELPPSASSSPQITMVSRFTDHKLSDRKAGSKGISGILEY
ncbi:hypothetical protein Tco_0356110 [Tanacetum coccineum]